MSITLSSGLRLAAIGRYMHWCPGCAAPHFIDLGRDEDGRKVEYNADFARPTFSPDLRARADQGLCHYHLTDGRLEFMADSWHDLRGTVQPLPDFPMGALQVQPEPRP
jgi:hypothetical protein